MKNIVRSFKHRKVFVVSLLSMVLIIYLFVWKYKEKLEADHADSADISAESTESDESIWMSDIMESDHEVIYTNDGVMFQNEQGMQSGPYKYIYVEDLESSNLDIARYIGQNGLIGYIKKDGTVLKDPVFVEASEFHYRKARVREQTGGVYFINSDGERITRDYQDAYDYENQGLHTRVQLEDGSWGIINRQDELIFEGADFIEELPFVDTLGSAVIDGHAVLFVLDIGAEKEFSIIAEFEEFPSISDVKLGTFAFVQNHDGLYGAVKWDGTIILPAEYKTIDYWVLDGGCYFGDKVLLIGQKSDGTYDVIKYGGGWQENDD